MAYLGKKPVDFNDVTEAQTFTVTSLDANGGTIDGTVIGGTTPAAGTFTTGDFNTSLNVDGTITSDGLTIDNNGSIIFNDPQATDTILIGTNDDDLVIRADAGDILLKTNNNSTSVVVDASGNCGIGTSSVDTLLHLSKTTGGSVIRLENPDVGLSNGEVVGKIEFETQDAGGAGVNSFIQAVGRGTGGANNLEFATGTAGSPSVAMTIQSDQNVGIGTSSPTGTPTTTLHINGTTNAGIHITDSASGATDSDGVYFSMDNPNLYIQNKEAGFISFETSGTEHMRIDSSGNLLVGPTSSQSGISKIATTFNSTSQYGLEIKDVGAGSTATLIVFYRGSSVVGSITTNGSTTAYNTSSDYRLKENVTDITDGIERVKQLNPSRFNFIADADTTVDGFLAHEVSDIVPEAITGEKDAMRDEEYEVTPAVLDDDGNIVTEAVMGTRSVPDYQGIDQSKLVPLLTAALQEAIAKIETLETQNADIETRLTTLENA